MLLKDLLDEIEEDDRFPRRAIVPAEALDPDRVVSRAVAEHEWRAAGRYESIPAPARRDDPKRHRPRRDRRR